MMVDRENSFCCKTGQSWEQDLIIHPCFKHPHKFPGELPVSTLTYLLYCSVVVRTQFSCEMIGRYAQFLVLPPNKRI